MKGDIMDIDKVEQVLKEMDLNERDRLTILQLIVSEYHNGYKKALEFAMEILKQRR